MLSALLFLFASGGALAGAFCFLLVAGFYLAHGSAPLALQALCYSGVAAALAGSYGVLALNVWRASRKCP